MSDTTERERAQRRIDELLSELVDAIGPAAECEPGDEPSGTPILVEYVVVACWVDEASESFTTVTPAAGMIHHHTLGLLADALGLGPT